MGLFADPELHYINRVELGVIGSYLVCKAAKLFQYVAVRCQMGDQLVAFSWGRAERSSIYEWVRHLLTIDHGQPSRK